MATRTNDLTEFAKPIADDLAARMGTLKNVLSAGIMALNDMSAKEREKYMAKAVGKDIKPANDDSSENAVYDEILKLADQWKVVNKNFREFLEVNLPKTKHRRKTV